MTNLTEGFSFEKKKTDEVVKSTQDAKKAQLDAEDKKAILNHELDNNSNTGNLGTNAGQIEGKTETEGDKPKGVGFFGTLGLSFISISNHAIKGAPIEVDNIKLMDVHNMDELVVNEIIDSGRELDEKYFKDKTATPEMRYGMSILLFHMIKGRFGNAREWIKKHRKTKDTDKNKEED